MIRRLGLSIHFYTLLQVATRQTDEKTTQQFLKAILHYAFSLRFGKVCD